MLRKLQYALFLCALIFTAHLAQGLTYFYLTDHERLPNGDVIRFYGGDTLWGPVHSNDTIHIMQNPVFYDIVSSSAPGFGRGTGYNPLFHGPNPIFNAPEILIPSTVNRDYIPYQHRFNVSYPTRARVVLEDHNLRITWGILGVPFDTLDTEDHLIEDAAIVLFECPIWLSGTCHTVLTLCAAGNIYLEDNILYPSADTLYGVPDDSEEAMLALISEGDIVIANTWANGRNNRELGANIIIDAYLAALGGSFLFAQQNDLWDLYQGPSPDERGQIFLHGGVTQRQRYYLHRSNHGGTGYDKAFRWDARMRYWNFYPGPGYGFPVDTIAVDFGDVAVGTTVWDSVEVHGGEYSIFSGAITSPPFHSTAGYSYHQPVTIPISFTPQQTRHYAGLLYYYLDGRYHSIPLSGNGVAGSGPLIADLNASPNPFNPVTTLRLTLAASEHVSLSVYNITGQLVEAIVNEPLSPGEHRFAFDGSALASGLYIARLHSPSINKTAKLLLIK